MNDKAMFADAKMGDRVWSSRFGEGRVHYIYDSTLEDYYKCCPLLAIFNGRIEAYTMEGVGEHDLLPTLFWDEVKITPPPRPKRMVKKVVEGWVNVYSPRHPCVGAIIHLTEHDALDGRNPNVNYLGTPLFIRYEYEVEE